MAFTPVFLPGEFHKRRRLVGYSRWCHKELDTTERLTLSQNQTKPLGKRKGEKNLGNIPKKKRAIPKQIQ